MIKRIFLIVLDSMGCGECPDSILYGDRGSNTLKALCSSKALFIPNLEKMGLFNIDKIDCGFPVYKPISSFGKLQELSRGKDTTTGHWEMAGIVSSKSMPVFQEGLPQSFIENFEKKIGKKVLCNRAYSGTDVIKDFGKEHIETGNPIVYTSADSVFQIACHTEVVPLAKLYEYCQTARELLTGDLAVGRVIARPFNGKFPDFTRTSDRKDFSLLPPAKTMLDIIKENGKDVIAVGKIHDIFAGQGITESKHITSNIDGMEQTIDLLEQDFNGLCFVNLVEFDSKFGHRNDIDGYAKALSEFDEMLGAVLFNMQEEDVLMITADHGCDPSTPSTNHSREYVPLLIYGKEIKNGINLGIRKGFNTIGGTILEMLNIKTKEKIGESFLSEIKN